MSLPMILLPLLCVSISTRSLTSNFISLSRLNHSSSVVTNIGGILSVPTLSLLSPSSWGTFSPSGPFSQQIIEFEVYGSSSSTWSFYSHFDLEAWSYVGSLGVGVGLLTIYASNFQGERISGGSHTVSLRASDGSSYSNTLVVSYDIEGASTGLIVGIVIGVIALIAIIGAIIYCVVRKNKTNQNNGAALSTDSMVVSGYQQQGDYSGGNAYFPPNPGYPTQPAYPVPYSSKGPSQWPPGYPPPSPPVGNASPYQGGGQPYQYGPTGS